MRHPFGVLIRQHLARKSLSQGWLAECVAQDSSVISDMCNGRRLTGPQVRGRVVDIIEQLHRAGALEGFKEANALFRAAGIAEPSAGDPLFQRLKDAGLADAGGVEVGPPEAPPGQGWSQTTGVHHEDREPGQQAARRSRLPILPIGRRWLILAVFLAVSLAGAALRWPGRDTPPARPMTGIALQRFGATFAPVGLTLTGNEYGITAPGDDDRYANFWGAYQAGARCAAEVEFDARIEGDTASPGFGYAVAPRSTITNDQPNGWSVQFEWDGDAQGYYIRPALLPSGARFQGEVVTRAPDVRDWHHVRVVARGIENEVFLDRKSVGVFRSSSECGGVALRVWDGTLYIRNLTVPNR